jgi:hypothetical protein
MSIPRNWRLQQQRYRLTAKTCERCGRMIFPPRNVCPQCDATARTLLFAGGREEFSGIPVEVVTRETQSGSEGKVLVYGYKSRLVTTPTS